MLTQTKMRLDLKGLYSLYQVYLKLPVGRHFRFLNTNALGKNFAGASLQKHSKIKQIAVSKFYFNL